jgi:hypothetical protein
MGHARAGRPLWRVAGYQLTSLPQPSPGLAFFLLFLALNYCTMLSKRSLFGEKERNTAKISGLLIEQEWKTTNFTIEEDR